MKVIKVFLLSNKKKSRPVKNGLFPHTMESANELLPGAFYLSGKHHSRVLRSKKSYWWQQYSVVRYTVSIFKE